MLASNHKSIFITIVMTYCRTIVMAYCRTARISAVEQIQVVHDTSPSTLFEGLDWEKVWSHTAVF